MKDKEKVDIIKNIRFLTNTKLEWNERYGYLKKDYKAIMEQVREDCAANYPEVDIDQFVESYVSFNEAPLRTSLTDSRISAKQWNMKDQQTFISVMRYVMKINGADELPQVGRRDILEMLRDVDPAVAFLVYFHPDGNTPILPPPKQLPGDNEDDYSLYLNCIDEALRKIYQGQQGFFDEPPRLSMMMSQFNAINSSGNGKRMVRMDLINLVTGVLANIGNNSSSENLHYANLAAIENRVNLGLQTGENTYYRSNYNQIWQIEGEDGSYIMTRYEKTNGRRTYAKFLLNVYRDEECKIVGSIESADMVKATLRGEPPAASYAILDITDKDGATLIGINKETPLRPARVKFSYMTHSVMDPSKLLGCSELHIMTTKEKEIERDAIENINKGLYNECATACDFPTRAQEVFSSDAYIYLSCETEEVSAQDKKGIHQQVGMRIKSWFRIPRRMEYKTRLGDVTDLSDMTEYDRPSWRRFRDENGKMVEVIYFALHNIAIDVTRSMRPKNGDELPHGIVVVNSPSPTVLSNNNTFVRVKSAKAIACGNSYKASVTYEYSDWNEDELHETVIEEDIVSVKEQVPY